MATGDTKDLIDSVTQGSISSINKTALSGGFVNRKN
jgi:hypothetical protein